MLRTLSRIAALAQTPSNKLYSSMVSSPTSPILIAGPTASGKSALAVRLAEIYGGVVINADAIQVYAELSILSARPTPADEARAPHWLYGYVSASVAYSVGRYVVDAADALGRAEAAGLRPIVVGGTGLFFKALLEGLSPIPAIEPGVRAHWRALAERHGAQWLHTELSTRDPVMAARLAGNDTQRLTRALEVLDATGRSLADWQRQPGSPVLVERDTVRLVLRPERTALLARCDTRCDLMMAAGAVAEVQNLIAAGLGTDLPAMRALGVSPLTAFVRGDVSEAVAVARVKLDTRQYVKRQLTWLKRNMLTWNDVQTFDLERNCRSIKQFIDCCAAAD